MPIRKATGNMYDFVTRIKNLGRILKA